MSPATTFLTPFLSGRTNTVIRPSPPASGQPRHGQVRHDLYAPQPTAGLDDETRLRRQLGAEHFIRPEPEEPAEHHADDGKLHPIGDLARLLGVKVDTVRHWESSGIIPPADHYTAGIPGLGKEGGRKRRYTSAQLTGLVEIYEDEGVHHGNINSTRFSERAWDLWRHLANAS